ncbi:MAG: RteC domain-containing protein [Saprospiraceae bacterium]|nr:RteC domain-containing protein [Saprospiraceae bacterium]
MVIDNGFDVKLHDLKSNLKLHNLLSDELEIEEKLYTFKSESEEIRYYKIEKPDFMKYGIFLHAVNEMYLNEPIGFCETKLEFLHNEMNKLRTFQIENNEMYKYYKAIETNRDSELFNKHSVKKDIFAVISASFMLEKYLYSERDPRPLSEKLKDYPVLKWNGPKVGLVEIIYALAYAGNIEHESKELDYLVKAFENLFDIDLGNHYRIFLDIRNREEPAKLLLSLVDVLHNVVDILNENLDNRKDKPDTLVKIKAALEKLRQS